MALNEADLMTIANMINAALAQGQLGRQCTAEYFHEGKLRYTGSRGSGVYICECGKRYVKDGRGGLMDAPVRAPQPALVGG